MFSRDLFINLDEQLGGLYTEPQDIDSNISQILSSFNLTKLAAKSQIEELERISHLS